ncbi:MAG: KTSC domain-containing protein [Deltaproteobacteria bacterium HGW-Deltaproteobacteria-15]|jgi:hypothetical protein|nr:MAG: KTSC domain-containing protein [Deltaproteobacteria bacterium HGW-Deltaproteobacteria-15]
MNDIEMIPTIGSSTVDSIGYDEAMQILRVKFLKGGLYEYRNVPLMEFEQLRNAPSVGSYLARNIKGSYPYDRIG